MYFCQLFYVTVFGKIKREKQKKNYCFVVVFQAKILPSKFEANPTLSLRPGSFSIIILCLNDYFRMYAIIDFLANRLVFVNTVTYVKMLIYNKLDMSATDTAAFINLVDAG